MLISFKKDHSVLIAANNFSARKLPQISKNLQPITKRIVRNILGVTGHKTQMFLDHKRTILLQENYITQLSEEVEGRVTKKMSQGFSRTESRIWGALSHLDDFLQNPLVQGHSATTPETSRKAYGTNQGTNKDDSRSGLHPEASHFSESDNRKLWPQWCLRQLPAEEA